MIKTSPLLILIVQLACLSFSRDLLGAQPATCTNQPEKDEKEWTTWLVQVQHVDRQDPAGEDAARLKELAEKVGAATKPDERPKLQRELDRAGAEAAPRRGFVVYGWSLHADDAGKPVDTSRGMSGFLLPAGENTRALQAAKEGSFIAVTRQGSEDLFTCSGRRYFRAAHAARAKPAPDKWSMPKSFRAPPKRRDPAALRRAIETTLTFVKTQQQEKGGELHRFMIGVEATSPPRSAKVMHVWFHVRLTTPDGSSIGPILEHIDVKRGTTGEFRISRSFEFISRGKAALDPDSAAAEPIAIEWESAG